jgi:hypothetical protein
LAKLKDVADNKKSRLEKGSPGSPLQGIALLLVIAVLTISLVSSGDFHFPTSLKDSAKCIQRLLPVEEDGPCLLCSIFRHISGFSFCSPCLLRVCEVLAERLTPPVSSDVGLFEFDVCLNRGPPASL